MSHLPFLRWHLLDHPIERLADDQRRALDRFRTRLARGAYALDAAPCLCGKPGGWLIARRDRYALAVNTLLCPSCSVMRQSPRLAVKSLARFYEEDYRPIYGGQIQAPDDFFAAQAEHGRAIYDFVATTVRLGPDLTVFDVGCGAGGALVPFVEAGWRAIGCDVGSAYLEWGRAAGLTLEHGDAAVLAQHGPANLVILSHVVEHLPDPRRSLEEVSALLVDGGHLYVELPGIFGIRRTYGDFLAFLQNAHLYHFTLATLASLMAQAGFRLVRGDETIRALFRKDRHTPPVPTERLVPKILAYLILVELERIGRAVGLGRRAHRLAAVGARKLLGDRVVENVKGRLRWPQRSSSGG